MKGYLGADQPIFWKCWIGVAALLLSAAVVSCGKESTPPDVPDVPESFAFFEIGANTRLTDGLQSTLRGKLGNDSISGRNVLNLEINFSGFLREHFPTLESLNRRLNGSGGIRIEHDTVTLMYRHMQKLPIPFDDVELVFDGVTRKPLVIRIRSARQDADILETLTGQYQEPRTIRWGEGSQAYSWEKNGDILILSVTPNPVGRPVYTIGMYYVNSITAMLNREQAGGGREEDGAVKDAFSRKGPDSGTRMAPEPMRSAFL